MANGKTEEARARARWQEKMRNRGTPCRVLPQEFEEARNLILKARAYGMDDGMIARQLDCNEGNIYKIRTLRSRGMLRTTYERIMLNLRPEQSTSDRHPRKGKVPDGACRSAVGTQRRLQALRADGFTNCFLAELLEVTPEAVSELTRRERSKVYQTTYVEIKALYEKLAGTRPEDSGIHPYSIQQTQNWAVKRGYIPSHCWDDDTIDNPDAIPQWTGECGSMTGVHIHRRDGIPMCDACKKIWNEDVGQRREGYRAERATRIQALVDQGLTPKEIAAQLGVSGRTVQRALTNVEPLR